MLLFFPSEINLIELDKRIYNFSIIREYCLKNRRYPPVLDVDLEGLDAGLASVKTQSLEGEGQGEGQEDGVEEEVEAPKVLPSTAEERREAKRKLKAEMKKIRVWYGMVCCSCWRWGRNKSTIMCM